MQTFPRFSPGGSFPTAADLNKITTALDKNGKVFAAPPLYVQEGPGGTTFTFADGEFWAVICCQTADGYELFEVALAEGAAPVKIDGGRHGFGRNLNSDLLNAGQLVRVYPGYDGAYIFQALPTSPILPGACPGECGSSESSSESSSSSSSCVVTAATAEALAGPGLVAIVDPVTGCAYLEVDPGCHVTVDEYGVSVDTATLVGRGLELDTDSSSVSSSSSSGCPAIRVKTSGCIKATTADGVYLDTTITETTTIEVAGAVVLSISGSTLTATTPITTWEYGLNSCGVVVSITDLGTTYTDSSVDVGVCCSSSSSSSDSSSSSSDSCAGWYCCQETNTVTYLADCAAVDGYSCGSSSSSGGGVSCDTATLTGYESLDTLYGDGWWYINVPGGATVNVTYTGSTGGNTLTLWQGTDCANLTGNMELVTDGTYSYTMTGTNSVLYLDMAGGAGSWTIEVTL